MNWHPKWWRRDSLRLNPLCRAGWRAPGMRCAWIFPIATVSDPACGAAGMLIAYAECLLEADINPSMHMFGSCIDIDPVAADMAFIQLSLLGIAAEVVTGNTLTMQFRRVRYTPVYYLNDFEKRLADLTRFRAMRDFMRGIQEAA